jgi:hypothetical protein
LQSSELILCFFSLDIEAPPPPQVLALCSVVVWYSVEAVSIVDDTITGYDVRFYSPQSNTQNMIKHVGANRTFYIIQSEDKTVANPDDIYIQVIQIISIIPVKAYSFYIHPL